MTSLTEIKRAIPLRCFHSNLVVSCWYVVRALSFASGLVYALCALRWYIGDHPALYALYIFLQGTVFWGIFTIGHDCGHDSFSRYPAVNWFVGNFLHTLILTPYEPWRQSHRSHHSNTGNSQRDEVFYPKPPFAHKLLTLGLGVAWFIYILVSNVPGRRNYYAYISSEFKDAAVDLCTSFLSMGLMLLALAKIAGVVGWAEIVLFYGAPLFVFASWLVVVTFLHHHDESVQWFPNAEWSRLKGSLASVDRDYGAFINNISHSINLHQIHHLFPAIPHYHLAEATEAFKTNFPHLYKSRGGSNIIAFAREVFNWI